MDQAGFEHEVRNAAVGVILEVKRIRQAMSRLENHLQRMDKACAGCGGTTDATKQLQKNGWKRVIQKWPKFLKLPYY